MARRKKQNEEDPSNDNQENPDHSDNINNDAADDTFGLPEVEYEPIKRDEPLEEPSEPVEEPVYETPVSNTENTDSIDNEPLPVYESREEELHSEDVYEEPPADEPQEFHSRYSYMEENNQPVWPKVLAIVLLILLAGSAFYYFFSYRPQQQAAEQRELEIRENRDRELRAERERQAEVKRLQDEAAQRRADSLANIPKEGSIEKLSGRTGQYWVVVASAIDDDLLMDFAQKLSKDGKQVKIIPPFGKQGKFHRLAIDSRDSYADAQAAADGMKGGEFGDQLWVVRY